MIERYVINPLVRLCRQPSFIACILVLAVCAGGVRVAAERFKWIFRKESIYLRKGLDELDLAKLEPYQLPLKGKHTLSEEIITELGTREYIQWFLEDTSVDERDPMRWLSLFVTYYTGNPDKVPHVPDVCYVGGGGLVRSRTNTTVNVPGVGAENNELPLRILNLELPSMLGHEERTVGYFFAVNGTYRHMRDQVRLLQNNMHDRYTYFSKVEMHFPHSKQNSQAEIIAGMERFLRVLVPVLYQVHWPDWEKASTNG